MAVHPPFCGLYSEMTRIQPVETNQQGGVFVNGMNGPMTHHPLTVPLVTAPLPQPAEEGKPDYHAIYNAFRRRWFLALSLGLLFGVPAAIAAWILAPAPYIGFAELRLHSLNSNEFPGSKGTNAVADFNIWKEVVKKRATHPEVLMAVLADREAFNTRMLREEAPHEVSWLEENLVVKFEGTEYLRLHLEGEDPHEVTAIVKAISKALEFDVNEELKTQRTKKLKAYNEERTKVNLNKTNKTSELEGLREKFNIDPALIARQQLFLSQQEQRFLELERRDREFELQLELDLSEKNRESTPSVENLSKTLIDPQVAAHPDYQEACEQVFKNTEPLEIQKKHVENVKKELSENHPQIVAAVKKLEELQKVYDEKVENLKNAEAAVRAELLKQSSLTPESGNDRQAWITKNRESIRKLQERNKAELEKARQQNLEQQKDLDLYAIQAADLTEDIKEVEKKLDLIDSEISQLQFDNTNSPDLITISREAEVPHLRSLKKKAMLSGASGLGIFAFFVAGIVFFEHRTQRIASMHQISEQLKLPVMGAVPLLPTSATRNNTAKRQAKNAIWYSALTEAVDSIRTLLIRGSQMDSLKTLMISSAVGGEGKTTMASHLATSLARGGRKILLIDCDLRRPCVHRAFDLPSSDGVCEILRGEASLSDCIQHLESPSGLSILPAGKVNQQVLKALAMHSLDELLDSLKPQYDFIIVDSSPLLPVTDALLVAQHVDGVILSIRRDVSRVGKVVMACQKLSMLGVPLLGAVTIGLQEKGEYPSKYGHNYYTYGYGQQPVQ